MGIARYLLIGVVLGTGVAFLTHAAHPHAGKARVAQHRAEALAALNIGPHSYVR